MLIVYNTNKRRKGLPCLRACGDTMHERVEVAHLPDQPQLRDVERQTSCMRRGAFVW